MIWHSSSGEEVCTELVVDHKRGLSNGEVEIRMEKYGNNVISKIEKPSFLKRFLSQLNNKTVISLIIISFISFLVSLVYDEVNSYSPLLIIAIVIINAIISAYYIYSCDNTLDNLKKITNPSVSVLRDGILKSINSAELVPGDIIMLSEGDFIPADARIIESNEFRCNEVALTGVEVPVEKNADAIFEDITVIEKRSNMVFCGTNVAHGTAKVVVVATGLNTESGRTSVILQQTSEDKLPLENSLSNLGKIVNSVIFVICILTFIIGIIQNFSTDNFASMTLKTLVNSVALAVAAIPEGLPAITTIVIAIGMHRILKDKIIVKDASAAELLGKTDILCCDKTGVFTHNKMKLSKIFDGNKICDLESEDIDDNSALIIKLATACSTLNNDSTEKAIEDACLAYNSMSLVDINALFPHITEIPFDIDRKTMTVITMINERPVAIVKGAPETVLPNCVNCDYESVLELNYKLADEAYRNVCIAMRQLSEIPANPNPQEIESNLTFVGLLSLSDPPREGVTEEIEACTSAGIRTVMITGDSLNTAKAIARRIGILKDGDLGITGAQLNEMSDEELAREIDKYTVFARVSSNDKLRLVKIWKLNKKIVTITGDSVEDADALALADVGCAIGKFGADVAKGNADIIISNNRFGSIVNAIRESRGLFSNIRKSVYYLFSCNIAEILTVLIGLLIFGAMPVTAVCLLWINLLTDCAPAISLSMERAEDTCMYKKPLSSFGKIFDFKSVISISVQSIIITIATLISYSIGFDFGDSATAVTMAFATLGISQIFHCLNNKFEGSIFNKKLFSNRLMNFAVAVTLFVMMFLIFTPAGAVFSLKILKFSQFIVSFLLALIIIPVTEVTKYILRKANF